MRKEDVDRRFREEAPLGIITFRERKNKKDHELPITEWIEKYLVGGGLNSAVRRNGETGEWPSTQISDLTLKEWRSLPDGRGVSESHLAVSVTSAGPPTKVSNLHYVFCTRLGKKYWPQEVTKAWRIANRQAHGKYGVPIVVFKNATRHSLVCQMMNEGRTFEEIGSITGNSPRVLGRHYGQMNMKRKLEILRRGNELFTYPKTENNKAV